MRLAVWFVSAIYPRCVLAMSTMSLWLGHLRSFWFIMIYLNMLLVTLPDFSWKNRTTYMGLSENQTPQTNGSSSCSLSLYIYNVCVRSFLGGKISFSETSHYIPMWLAINSIRPNFPCMILIYSDKPNQRWRNNMVVTISRAFFCIPPSAALVRTFAEARSWIHRDRTRKKSGRDLRLLGHQQ